MIILISAQNILSSEYYSYNKDNNFWGADWLNLVGTSFHTKLSSDRIFNEPFLQQDNTLFALKIASEGSFSMGNIFDLGVGIEYNIPRSVFDGYSQKVHFLPIYMLARVNLSINSSKVIYISSKFGYNIFFNYFYKSTDLITTNIQDIDLTSLNYFSGAIGYYDKKSILNYEIQLSYDRTYEKYTIPTEHITNEFLFNFDIIYISLNLGFRI